MLYNKNELILKISLFLIFLTRCLTFPKNTSNRERDFQKPYLELILRIIGFEDISTFVVEPTAKKDSSGSGIIAFLGY